MADEDLLLKIQGSIEDYDIQGAREYTQKAVDAGMSPDEIINMALAKGMQTISDRFDEGTCFLPQIMVAARAMEESIRILEPLMGSGDDVKLKGVIVMGSVKGDIHEIGKNVCCAMLRGAGFKVIDLGSDVSADDFAEAIVKNSADIVGASALMTTSLYQQKDLVRVLDEDGMSVITIFGGAPCTQEWVDEIGGDGYSATASEIVPLVRRLLFGEKPDD